MSLWACIEHGLGGPMACCGKASLASLTAVSQAASRSDIDAKDARIAQLEAALREITHHEFYSDAAITIARDALKGSAQETKDDE